MRWSNSRVSKYR